MEFVIWAVLLSEAAGSGLSMAMIRRGYTVGPPNSDGRSAWEGEASHLFVHKVSHATITDPTTVLKDVKEALTMMGAMWHSIVATAITASSWAPSNIRLPKAENPNSSLPPPPVEVVTRFDLIDKP